MNFYFSGPGVGPYNKKCAQACEYRLLSCYRGYLSEITNWMRVLQDVGNDHQEIMLDSGAFTTWSKGGSVSLRELIRQYRDFIRRYEASTRAIWLINLDKIPGSKGVEPSEAEIAAAIRESDKNLTTLQKEFGDRVLPVYHQGEPDTRLHEVAAQAAYICVSPRNDLPERLRVGWAQRVHHLINNRTHGLATTGARMATTVGWFSADSAAWRFAGAVGKVVFFVGGRALPVNISAENTAKHDANKHYDSMPAVKQRVLLQRIEQQGFTLDQLRYEMRARAAFTMLELIEWNKQKKVTPQHVPTLFGI